MRHHRGKANEVHEGADVKDAQSEAWAGPGRVHGLNSQHTRHDEHGRENRRVPVRGCVCVCVCWCVHDTAHNYVCVHAHVGVRVQVRVCVCVCVYGAGAGAGAYYRT